jgi:signal transduction histidine kinase
MSVSAKPAQRATTSILVGVIPLYMACAAIILRVLTYSYSKYPVIFPWYLGLILAFLFLFLWVTFRPRQPLWVLHAIYLVQSIIILCLVSLPPHLDIITALFTLLCYQMALVIEGRSRWLWCVIFCSLILISLVVWKGWILGLALALIPIAGSIVILSYVIANRQEQQARKQSDAILAELQEKNKQLQEYSSQAEQIAAIEERNRLARELHDSVSQTIFSIVLNVRSTQILMAQQPEKVRPQLEQLHLLAQEALAEMRSLITQLRKTND